MIDVCALSERQFSALIGAAMLRLGWAVELEKPCAVGALDVYAVRGGERRIIEVKVSLDSVYDARKLVAQLEGYAAHVACTSLWYLVKGRNVPTARRHMEENGILELPVADLDLSGLWGTSLGRAIARVQKLRAEEFRALEGFVSATRNGFKLGKQRTAAVRECQPKDVLIYRKA